MNFRWLGVIMASAFALAAQSAAAQSAQGWQGAIANEVAARAGMDATLLDAINDLRASVGPETSIVGRYVFTGTQSCMASSRGFNANLTPVILPASPPPAPGLPPIAPVTVITQSTSTIWGYRTFNADGTGSAEFHVQTLTHPGMPVSANGVGGFGGNGGATMSEQTGTFTWQLTADGKVIIEDSVGASGTIIKGGNCVGCTVQSRDVPRAVAILGKDLKTISITHDDVAVERGITINLSGQTSESQRICHRERTLRKM